MDILMAKAEEPTALVNPPEGVMDRIHFVINNVTTSNLSSKVCVCAVVYVLGRVYCVLGDFYAYRLRCPWYLWLLFFSFLFVDE